MYKDKVRLKNIETGEEKLFESIEDACNFLSTSRQYITEAFTFNKPFKGYNVEIIFGRKRREEKRLEDNVIDLPGEIWKEVPNEFYKNNYSISNMGRVKSFYARKDILMTPFSYNGFLYVRFSNNGVINNFSVARLVLSTFKPSPIENNKIIYKDEDRSNVKLSNLEWEKEPYNELNNEIWEYIPDYSEYMISNFGRIRRGFSIINSTEVKGYLRVSIKNDNNEWKQESIHRLVAITFLSKNKYDKSIQDKLVVNHLDGNKLNNYVKNLEWCLPKENVLHAYRTGLISMVNHIYVEYNEFVYIFYTSTEIINTIDDFKDFSSKQIKTYINSDHWYLDKYLLFNDKYIPFVSSIPDLPSEEWKVIKGTNTNYFISNKGRIKSFKLNHKEALINPAKIKQLFDLNMYQLMAKYFANVDLEYVYVKDGDKDNFSLDNLLFNEIENLPNEEWKKISTIWVKNEAVINKISNYEISTKGRIRCVRDSRMYISKGTIRNKGKKHKNSLEFRIVYEKKEYVIPVSRLMLLTFFPIESCKTYEDYSKYRIKFLSGNQDNNLENLLWQKMKDNLIE